MTRQYRSMQRIHALGPRHMAMVNNPPYYVTPRVRPARLGYRTALCGQVAYCCEDPDKPMMYRDQFGPVPFVSWRKSEHVTCKLCQRSLRR